MKGHWRRKRDVIVHTKSFVEKHNIRIKITVITINPHRIITYALSLANLIWRTIFFTISNPYPAYFVLSYVRFMKYA